MDDRKEDWIKLHCIEEELRKFEEAEREMLQRLRVPSSDETESIS